MEVIKLQVKKEASIGDKAQSITAKFIEACLALDASIFEPMIEENQYFEDLDKYRFLSSLKQQFDWAIKRGAKDITMKKGKCGLCVIGHSTYEFYSSQNTHEFAYIINTNKDRVEDIFLCNDSSGRRTT
ncbi:hypothetical protein [Maribacter sp. 2307ULW6-5]|uniref:hypothetical protein n=1 Tax=Maribacter sp. 2307ULW6-5 TaxID=3386275 RepID=UPI0039BD14F0